MDDLWQCDGCGVTGTGDELNQHVIDVNTLPDGSLKEPQDVTCWGSYQVGGPAWEQHQFEGVHPMTNVMKGVGEKYRDYQLENPDEDDPRIKGASRVAIHLEADAEQAKSTGGMLALVPRSQDAQTLAIPGGEPPEEMHVTLLYFGEHVQGPPPPEVLACMDQLARLFGTIWTKVFSHAIFNPTGSEGRDPCAVYLLGDSQELADLRRQAVDQLQSSSVDFKEQHEPWIPHITAGYGISPGLLSFTGPIALDTLLLSWAGEDVVVPLI
jgi:hypothetical protein